MVGLAREGHAPVTEMAAGEMYVISHVSKPESEWCKLLMYKNSRMEVISLRPSERPRSDEGHPPKTQVLKHYFWILAENSEMIIKEAGDIDRRTISYTDSKLRRYAVRLASKDELALFISADRVYNNLKRVLRYGRPTKRVKKVKIPFRAHMRKGHQK